MVSELHGWNHHFSWRPLSQDIRNYFGAKAPAAAPKDDSSKGNPTMRKKRPKPVVLSSSSESEGETKAPVVQVAKKKAKKGVLVTKTAQVLSDSGTYMDHHLISTYLLVLLSIPRWWL